MSKKLILLIGAPGSGKTTDGFIIAEKHSDITNYCTGELLHAESQKDTKLGKIMKGFLSSGKLVPTDIVIDIIVQAIRKSETDIVLLGGFPRKSKQMKMFADALFNIEGIEFSSVIEIKVSEEVARKRVFGEGKSNEAFDTEMKIYQDTIAEIEEFYNKDNLLQVVDGERETQAVIDDLDNILKNKISNLSA